MRLSPPTGKTFWPALGAIALGIVLWVVPTDGGLASDVAFWLTAAGGILLVLGSVFNKI